VVPGKIETIQVVSSSQRLQRRLLRLLKSLQGSVLHLPTLTAKLTRIQQLPGVGLLKTNLNRIGEDSNRAELLITVEPGHDPLRGELALRNDGNGGSGQFRGLATLVKERALVNGDTLLLFGEINTDSNPEIGSLNGSLSYTLPLFDRLSLTTAFGASRRTLVEAPPPLNDLSFRQLQLFSQLEYTLLESLNDRLTVFGGLSVNRNDAYLSGASIPAIVGGGDAGWLRTGFARIGLAYDRSTGTVAFNANLYGLQGIGAWSTSAQRQELQFLGGLPGQVLRGDIGLLGTIDLAWLLWRGRQDALQLVPFIGNGQVWTEVPGATISDSAGAGGMLLRWTRGRHGELELGWVRQFQSGSRAYWDQWILGNGFYTKLVFRF